MRPTRPDEPTDREPDDADAEPGDDPVEVPIGPEIDLHPFAPRDVRSVVEAYLEAAHAAGFTRVRIVHGRGTGAQREMVRAVLARSALVVSFRDAPPVAGGWGATVAELAQRPVY